MNKKKVMKYIIIRKNKVYYLKNMTTGELWNPVIVEDLRIVRDIMNKSVDCEDIEAYRLREQAIRDILDY
ncbi:MAG: hypothetical protein IJH63_10070 [Methanobrevibacter sp.]|nr:hypothetical protein [Methanosphaera sp.]MBR0371044.1 hypothetical protein [Methanobrevibacter sp.]